MISIGGIGGSGTRLVASMLESLGYFIGNDLNKAKDNLLFTFLFKSPSIFFLTEDEWDERVKLFMKILKRQNSLTNSEIAILVNIANDRRILGKVDWLDERIDKARFFVENKESHLIGWKEPNTHIIIERFLGNRDGLDMAYSANQNQLKLWEKILFDNSDVEITPANSLRYWCETHKRMIKLEKKYPTRVLLLSFDSLCLFPDQELNKFLLFLGGNNLSLEKERLTNLINIPKTIGRHKDFSLDNFYEKDLLYWNSIKRLNKVGFLICGTQKGGTTALDKYLSEHNDIGRAKG